MPASARLLNDTSTTDAGATAPLSEPSLFYDPPYDDPLDDAVAWHLVKYLAPAQGLRYRVAGPTTDRDTLTADFLVEAPSRRVALMITDGGPDDRDQLRDALWIGQGAADAVLRVRAVDLQHRLHDVLLLWVRWMPDLFSERGRTNLATLASPVARQYTPVWSESETTLQYDAADAHVCHLLDAPGSPSDRLVVRRLARQHPATWRADYERATATRTRSRPSRRRARAA